MSAPGASARADLLGGAGWIAFGLAILAGAWRMDRFEAMGGTIYTAPGLVPGLFGALLMLLGAALVWRVRRALHAGERRAGEALWNRRIGTMLALCLLYAIAAVGRVPFTLATALFVAAFTFVFADAAPPRRRLTVALLSGVLTAAAIVLVFERLFLVRLP